MSILIRRCVPKWHALTTMAALGLAVFSANAAPLDDMVAFDAVYIPALSMSSSASQDARAAPKAQATARALDQQWPTLKRRLAATWTGNAPTGWQRTLTTVERHIRTALDAAAKSDWKATHEALEPVRIELMAARQRQGMDYFVDRLTAYHEPMEVLALAGATLKPAQLDAARRAQLEQAYAEARALWRGIEQQPLDAAAYGLSAARQAQLRKALDDETAALARLSDALRGSEFDTLLKAAQAIKPPFSRAFTAFGKAEGESAL